MQNRDFSDFSRDLVFRNGPKCAYFHTLFNFALLGFLALALSLTAVKNIQAQSIGAFSGFRSGNNSPIQIEADRLDIFDKKAIAIFKGNVKVVQGKSLLKADNLKVYYKNNSKNGDKSNGVTSKGNSIERLEVSGTVYVKSEENEATGDSGSFNMISEDVELLGNVVLSQGRNVMTGCRFIANLKTGIAKMFSNCGGKNSPRTGRVKMLFEPKSAQTN